MFRAGFNVSLDAYDAFTQPILDRQTVQQVTYAKVVPRAEENATIALFRAIYNNSDDLAPFFWTSQPFVFPLPKFPLDPSIQSSVVNYYTAPTRVNIIGIDLNR